MAQIPVWKYRSTVLRLHDGKQEIDIFANQRAMPEGVTPAGGDQISGALWLQESPYCGFFFAIREDRPLEQRWASEGGSIDIISG